MHAYLAALQQSTIANATAALMFLNWVFSVESQNNPSPRSRLRFIPDDELLLVHTIYEGRERCSLFEILQGLDTVCPFFATSFPLLNPPLKRNGHAASKWTAFYLKNSQKINALVSAHTKPKTNTQVEPTSSLQARPSNSIPNDIPGSSSKSLVRIPYFSTTPASLNARRSRKNPDQASSETKQHANSNFKRREKRTNGGPLMRSSTPPTLVSAPRPQKYTPEDVAYFRKTLNQWLDDPRCPINYRQLSKKLAGKTIKSEDNSEDEYLPLHGEESSGEREVIGLVASDCEATPVIDHQIDNARVDAVQIKSRRASPVRGGNRFLDSEEKATAKHVASISLKMWNTVPTRVKLLKNFQIKVSGIKYSTWAYKLVVLNSNTNSIPDIA
ncbi:hypothetical protein M422DRAFT_56791 [Sphaerobolus stellatus SS14]|uniref:Uncharacterized protein n=1 Tax=Sphaerobolus stellatus (strain SS14) TaxID=990650 RepID=A0A0C9U3C1_SPHS4|nr:hypothetical protein M422DRAFT_56791 [Sphaerobolus stellatus SS14]